MPLQLPWRRMAETLACRSCGNTALIDLGACTAFAGADAATSCDPGRLLRCRGCGLGQRHPVPDEQRLISMYRETPDTEMAYRFEDNAAWSAARQRLLSRFADRPNPTVLDVGCHTGAFLAGLPSTWLRHGIESARAPMRVASEQHGVTLIGERLESISPEWAHRFDAVTMFDVIEHLPDPDAGIAHAARLLKPGGTLVLSSADMDAWTWRWLGSGHWYLQTPQHLSVISRPFLQLVGKRYTLELVDVQRIPHRLAPLRQRWREAVEIIYWGMRQRRGLYRIPHRLLQSLPGLSDLRHMQSVPWTMKLTDHLMVQLET